MPNAKFVHSVRNGHDVALSFKRLGWGGGGSYAKLVRIWLDRVSTTRKLCRDFCEDNYLEIDFRNLTLETERCVRLIYEFCGLDFRLEFINAFSQERAQKHLSNEEFPNTFKILANELNKDFKWF